MRVHGSDGLPVDFVLLVRERGDPKRPRLDQRVLGERLAAVLPVLSQDDAHHHDPDEEASLSDRRQVRASHPRHFRSRNKKRSQIYSQIVP